MQTELFIEHEDYSTKVVLVGLSGGINSAAVLVWLSTYPAGFKPKELHLFYAHFAEHSPDTEEFVLDCVKFAKENFDVVFYKQTNNSILEFFKEIKMIPHPTIAPCTKILKILPMHEYFINNKCDIDLIGYVKEETRRIKNMWAKAPKTKETKGFPISNKSNEWCFEIVKKYIGWYPKIYDLKNYKNERIFTHNNCLPCKNMQTSDFNKVKEYYPEYWQKAIRLSNELKKHWGRDGVIFEQKFMQEFGREDFEVDYKTQICDTCNFD